MKTYIRKYAAGQGIAGEESLKQVIVVTVASSSVTTVRSLTMGAGGSVARSRFSISVPTETSVRFP